MWTQRLLLFIVKLHNLSWWQTFINSHNTFCEIYTGLNNVRRVSVFEFWRCYYSLINRFSTSSGISDIKLCPQDVIISLTTYDKRLNAVYLAIESVMNGSIKPNKIIL